MQKKSVRVSKRCLSFFLSVLLGFCLIGCSPDNTQPVVPDTEIQPSSEPVEPVSDDQISGKITDNGQPIYDFDEFANREWYEGISNPDKSTSYFYEMYDELYERMKDILENTDISTLDEGSGLYKAIILYRDFMDVSDVSSRIDTIKDYIRPIENVKSLNDLYVLYSNEDYARINYLLNFNVKADNYGSFVSYIVPLDMRETFTNDYSLIKDGGEDSGLNRCLSDLGYDETELDEIYENAFAVCDKIDSYLEVYNQAQTYYYYPYEEFPGSSVEAPVMDIISSLDGLGSINYILAEETFADFYNDIFVPGNLEMLKDYLLVSSFWILPFSAYENFPDDFDGLSYEDLILHAVVQNAADVLADEYMKRYCDEEDLKDVNSMVLSVKTAAIKVITGVSWLGDGAREASKQKISRMIQYIGQNGHRNLLNDYELTDDPIVNLINLTSNNKHFERIQTYYSDTSRAPYGKWIVTSSPYYAPEVNYLCVTPVMMCDEMFTDADAFEEKLGFFGFIVAHEIGHSGDTRGIGYDWEGDGTVGIFGDESYDDYDDMIHSIIDYFDGIGTYHGREYVGLNVRDEAYADLFAMRVCLNILSEQENPDYDLFFRTYATSLSGLYVESDMDKLIEDPHLMAKERINYILGQFDEFYETYEIDENSPYYIPEDERLNIF